MPQLLIENVTERERPNITLYNVIKIIEIT